MRKTADSNEHKSIDLNAYFIFGAIVLVFLLGMYAIFSPGVQTQGNPACGKIVIAADGSTLRANVAQSLQDALYFLVVDPLSGKLVEVVRNPYRGPQPSAQIAYLVAGKGEEAVIVGNIDQQSYNILMQFGIRTFGGYTGQAKKVITLYRQARISAQSPTAETLPQPALQPAPAQPVAWGVQPAYSGPVYPNAFPGNVGPNCPLPGSGQGWGQAALTGLPDGDTIRRNNVVSQVALAQQAAMAQQAALAQQPPANVANNPLWERAAVNMTGGQYLPVGGAQGYFPPSQYPASQYPQANGPQAAALAQQAAMAQQAALAQQPPADVANNPLWERAAAAMQPQQQGNITWELAAQAQQQAAAQHAAAQQAAVAQQAAINQQVAAQQAAMAQQAALAQQPPANVANNPLWERAAVNMTGGQYLPVGGAQGYFPPSQYPASQYPQANAMAPVAAQVPIQTAPAIFSNAQMPHAYRGNCIECHQIIDAQANTQNTQQAAANQMMWNNNMAQDQNSVRAGVGNGVR